MTRPLPQFKGGAAWQSTRSCDVEKLCGYITDDGTVAAYFRIPREEVAKVRKSLRKAPAEPSPTSKDAEPIPASSAVAYDRAKADSARLLIAIQNMFALFERQHGLQPGEGQILQLRGYGLLSNNRFHRSETSRLVAPSGARA